MALRLARLGYRGLRAIASLSLARSERGARTLFTVLRSNPFSRPAYVYPGITNPLPGRVIKENSMIKALIAAVLLLGVTGAAQAAGMAPLPMGGVVPIRMVILDPPPPPRTTFHLPPPIVVPCLPTSYRSC